MGTLWVSRALLVVALALGLFTPVKAFTLAELSVANLSSQTVLNISYRGPGDTLLSGPIPTDLGALTNLTTLVLTSHNLSGGIPLELGNLTGLKYLDVSNNSLTGSIPPELGRLNSLTHLQLSQNRLSGSIPAELGRLVNVTYFELSYNELSGSVPGALGNLTHLIDLQLHNNNLTGPLPLEIGNMASLTSLALQTNQINGSLPPEMGMLANLESLSLDHNQLSGPLPAELGNMTSLNYVNLLNNSLSGPIPDGIGRLSHLQDIFLDNNTLSGAIPSSIGNLTRLSLLGLSSNLLSGSIPASLGSLPSATFLGLGSNRLSGSIPPELGNLSTVLTLDLSKNNLTGLIPQELANVTSLINLLLNVNHLSGLPPPQLASLSNLKKLDLRNNSLLGVISPEFAARFGPENLLPGNPLLSVGTSPGPPPANTLAPSPGLFAPTPAALTPEPAVTTPPPSVGVAQPAASMSPVAALPIPFAVTPPPATQNSSSSGGSPVAIIAAVAGGAAAAMLAAALAGICLYQRRKRRRNGAVPLASKPGALAGFGPFDQPPSSASSGSRPSGLFPSQRQFTVDGMKTATNNWSDSNIVGSGSFGTVYRGTLPDGTTVAIKRLDQRRWGRERAVEERSWNAELAALSKVRHKNLVHFMGACKEGDERLLVFEFVPGGSLGQRLHSAREGGVPFLSWAERMSVIEGVCRGLAYLHHDISPPLLHRDIKASNILLKGDPSNVPLRGGDSDGKLKGGPSKVEGRGRVEACIADFGLAHLLEDADSARDTSSAVKGTLSYMAPEYLQGGSQFLSTKCDVYSFGVLTLEILSGHAVTERPSGTRFEPLASRATRLFAEGRGREFIDGTVILDSVQVREAECCLQIALGCLQREPFSRPTMEQIRLQLRMLAPRAGGSERSLLSGEESASPVWALYSTEGSSSGQLSSAAWGLLPVGSLSQPVPFQFLDGR